MNYSRWRGELEECVREEEMGEYINLFFLLPAFRLLVLPRSLTGSACVELFEFGHRER